MVVAQIASGCKRPHIGDLQDVAKLAHKAKGSAGACGAQNLYMAALELEMAARDSDGNCIRFLPPMVDAFETFSIHPVVRQLSSLDAGADASIG